MPEDQRNVPQGSLELDRLRLEADIENRRAELELKRDELQVKKSELKRGLWSTPFVIAVIGAVVALFGTALGLIGNAVVGGVNGYWSSHVEAEKDRSNLILEAIRTNGDQKAVIGNLTLLAKAKLLGDDEVQKNILALLMIPPTKLVCRQLYCANGNCTCTASGSGVRCALRSRISRSVLSSIRNHLRCSLFLHTQSQSDDP